MIGFRRRLSRLWVPVILRVWPLARLWYRAWGLTLDGHPDDEVWYFAYGANMHDSVFRGRRKIRPLEWRPGRIAGYRLRFNLEGRPIGKAAPANIAPDPDAEVWGVLYKITRKAAGQLDGSEGVPGRRYRQLWREAEDIDGNRITPAFTYIAEGKPTDGRPSRRYLTLLRDGARAHRLAEHWLRYLEGVKPAEWTGRRRRPGQAASWSRQPGLETAYAAAQRATIAATGLVYPVSAMVAMAVSLTAIFLNSLWGRPSLFFDAILSVGRPVQPARQAA